MIILQAASNVAPVTSCCLMASSKAGGTKSAASHKYRMFYCMRNNLKKAEHCAAGRCDYKFPLQDFQVASDVGSMLAEQE